MKKFTYLATALLVLAGAAGCKKNADVQEPEKQSSGRMIPFTVTAGQGGQKTSMVGSTLAWTAGDKLTVTDGTHSTELTLTDGAGTASGTFSGEISEDVADGAMIVGLYNATFVRASEMSMSFTAPVPAEQTYNATSFQPGIYPSVGTGTYNKGGSSSINLSINPMGVLRLNLKGTDTVKKVKITTISDNIAGDFNYFSYSGVSYVSGGNSQSVTITCSEAVTLTSSGVYFNFVTAPFESQKVTIEITKSDDSTITKNITVSVSSSSATKQDVEVAEDPSLCGGIVPVAGQSVTDLCGNTYSTVVIGTQTWITENFKCNKYSSNLPSNQYDVSIIGQNIPAMTSESSWTPLYKDGTAGGYGYYYNWSAAVGLPDVEEKPAGFSGNRQGICPDGWHLPTNGEFATLRDYIEVTKSKGSGTAGIYLKSESGWKSAGNGADCFGFHGTPAGQGEGTPHTDDRLRMYTATVSGNARLEYDSEELELKTSAKRNEMYSVRCIKN